MGMTDLGIFIEKEIKKCLDKKMTPYRIGKSLALLIEEKYGVAIPWRTLESKANYRKNHTVKNDPVCMLCGKNFRVKSASKWGKYCPACRPKAKKIRDAAYNKLREKKRKKNNPE
jgi:hypothetical protein